MAEGLPRRVEVVALPKCEAMRVDGQRCTKAISGREALERHGLTEHPMAGKACHWHLLGSNAMVSQGLEKRRANKVVRAMGEPTIIVSADSTPTVPEEVQTPALDLYSSLRNGDDAVMEKLRLRRRFGSSTP